MKIPCETCNGTGEIEVPDVVPAVLLKELLENSPDGAIINLRGAVISEPIDFTCVAKNVTIMNGVFGSPLRLRNADGWFVSACDFVGEAFLSMLGGDGWTITGVNIHDTNSMAQLQIADNDGKPPMNWTVRDSIFANQATSSAVPPVTRDPFTGGLFETNGFQCHNVYVHSDFPALMNGLFLSCSFLRAPWGSNLKLGYIINNAHCHGIETVDCVFEQLNAVGTNILLPGTSSFLTFRGCRGTAINNPLTVLHVDGRVQAEFQGCDGLKTNQLNKGRQVVSLSRKYVSTWYYTGFAWWYKAHSEHDVSPFGTSLEGILFTY